MPQVFGAVITSLLLILYCYCLKRMHHVNVCLNFSQKPCLPESVGEVIPLMFNMVGGLISALVIAVLAITPPKKILPHAFEGPYPTLRKIVVVTYVVVWVASGVFLIGDWIKFETVLPDFSTAAKAWFGLVVGAG